MIAAAVSLPAAVQRVTACVFIMTILAAKQ
jgi:hypothetical protein